MRPPAVERLIEYFIKLPGIGPRQAARFAYALLDEDAKTIRDFGDAIRELGATVGRCSECFRGVDKSAGATCAACNTDQLKAILVVEKDQDLDAVAKSGAWHEGYHVLGGTVSLLNEKTRVTDRIRGLFERLDRRTAQYAPVEVVLATSVTTEGDSTALYIERILEPFVTSKKISLARLGRGVSSGAEIEYADPQTLKSALQNRK